MALCLVLTSGRPLQAQEGSRNIDFTGSVGFGGYYRIQTPSPISLLIENKGDLLEGWALADMQGWVPPTYYTQPIIIPPGARQKVEIGCFGCFDRSPCTVPVSVLSANGDPLKQVSLESWMLSQFDSLVIHLGTPSEPLENLFLGNNPGFLNMASKGVHPSGGLIEYPPKIFPVVIDPGDLPSKAILLESVSLIATNVSTYLALDRQKKDTILEYVLHGGNVLIYYEDGIDPVDGWENDQLLAVTAAQGQGSMPIEAFLETCNGILPEGGFDSFMPPRAIGKTRGIHGEVFGPAEESSGAGVPDAQEEGAETAWDRPDSYRTISVTPTAECETVAVAGMTSPILVVRTLGGGHAGFAAFNPFEGGPAAGDPTIGLLAVYGLLDPFSPVRQLAADSVTQFRGFYDARIQSFFRQGLGGGPGRVMKWLDALGPVLIYLLALPLIAILARGRGNIILATFILWSVVFTGIAFFRTGKPSSEKIRLNEANLYWCEAIAPEESSGAIRGQSHVYSCMSYSATSSAPHTLTWNHSNAILDELADPAVWPYGTVTVEEGSKISLPNLPLEAISMRADGLGERTFVMRRQAPELTATGKLTVGPTAAHLKLDAKLPFPAVAGRISVSSRALAVGKNVVPEGAEIHLDCDLVDGEEIDRGEGLAPEYQGDSPSRLQGPGVNAIDQLMGQVLQELWKHVYATSVGRSQYYTQCWTTGRPQRAYLMLASSGVSSDVRVSRGELEQHALTIFVISIPIVYD